MPIALSESIRNRAVELGFDRVAFVPAQPLETKASYHSWLSEGRNGEMGYLDRHHELRVDASVLEPGTKTVIALLKNYNPGPDLLEGGLRIARYAHGDDYHELLRARMKELGAFIHAETGANIGLRPAVDSAPLLERDVAASAGLGWIGKNAMLINPEIGSYTFLAELLIDLEITESESPRVPNRCGSCSKCIDACPTGAIISPYVIDARRCISYLTIELRGPIPRALRPMIGDYLFGCDLCQDVCPWNSKSTVNTDPVFQTRAALTELGAADLLRMDQHTFSTVFRKSSIKRTKRRGLLRNAAVVIGNRRDSSVVPLLCERLGVEDEPLVRGHIAWALGRIGGDDARNGLRAHLLTESDPYVLEEVRYALET